jgi:segregation and condensation protein A
VITLEFPGFAGTARELADAVRRGKIAAKELPLLALIEQAIGQVQDRGLGERAEIMPILAELLLYKLWVFTRKKIVLEAEFEDEGPADAGSPVAFLDMLVRLEEAISFLTQRSKDRARVLPVPPPPLPKDRRIRPLSVDKLVQAVSMFTRRAELLIEPERFGLREAWERIKGFLHGVRQTLFGRLPFKGWAEQTVAFTALLEAKKTGEIDLRQEQIFGDIEIEWLDKQDRRVTTSSLTPNP